MATPLPLKKISRFCWQLLALILVLFALGVSLVRGLLPQVDEVRQQLETYVKRAYQIDVHVGRLSAQWQAFGPEVNIHNLVIPPQDKLPVTLIINRLEIKLDFWQSLLTQSPQIEDVIFDGVNVGLDIDKLGEGTLLPHSATVSSSASTNTDWLYQLLLSQLDRFSLTQATLQLLSQEHAYRPIHIRQLHWRNHGLSHRGSGEMYLDQLGSSQESLHLQLDIQGDGSRPDSLTGQIYLAAQSLDLGAWASHQPTSSELQPRLPLEGVVNLEAWLDIKQRSVASALVQFSPSWLQWSLAGDTQTLAMEAGQIQWQPTAQGWMLHSAGLKLTTNDQPWPTLQFAAKQQDDALFAYVEQLDLASVFPLLPLVPGVNAAELELWQQLAVKGTVGPIRLYQGPQQPLRAAAAVKQLNWQQYAGIPQISPLDLQLNWQDNTLAFAVPAQQYTLDFGDAFTAPLSFTGQAFNGQFTAEDLTLRLAHLALDNNDLALDAAIALDVSAEPVLSLAANVQVKNAANADKYFPVQAMGEALAQYLDSAIKAGHSDNGQVLWQGPLANFPFDDHSGVFQAAFSLQNAEYLFQPDWPAVTELSLDALFEDARMDIWVRQGKLLDVAADGAHVFIPELGERSLVNIQAELATQGAAATAVLQASPLAQSVGSILQLVQVKGPVTGRLDLSIPLYEGEAEIIQGDIGFENTPIYLAKPGIALSGVTGTVSFVNEALEAKGLKAKIFEQGVDLSFTTAPVASGLNLDLKLKSRWDLNRLPQVLHNPLSGFYQGKLDWNGALNILFTDQGYQLTAQANADLQGTSLTLPGIFAKPLGEPRPLLAELVGDEQGSTLRVKLDNQAEFIGTLAPDDGQGFQHYELVLGRGLTADEARSADQRAQTRQDPMGHIQLELGRVQFAPWLPLLNELMGQSAPPKTGILVDHSRSAWFPPLTGIDANIGNIDLLGQNLTGLKMSAKAAPSGWQVVASAKEFDGTIDVYPNWRSQGLKVAASRWYLTGETPAHAETPASTENPASAVTPASAVLPDEEAKLNGESLLPDWPPLVVNVEDFRFFDKPFGKLQLQARPHAAGYQIQSLSLNSPNVSVQGEGMWHKQDGQNKTELNVTLTANQFNHLSSQLGIDPGLNQAPLTMNAALSWQGAPYSFALETLNGAVKFDLGKGHLSQVSDKGTRIFSLFSLDSLVRKLSLDFSDVFGQGLYFNRFAGNLQIDHGVVKTTDTEMDAIAGNIKVRGFTDLTSESLQYDIRFVPQLASSVPTVVLLSTSAWTLGLGAFALTKVLEPVIEVISEIRFRVTGTMSEPVLEELERKSKEIEIPEAILPIVGERDQMAPADAAPNPVIPAPPLLTPDSPKPEAPAVQPAQNHDNPKEQGAGSAPKPALQQAHIAPEVSLMGAGDALVTPLQVTKRNVASLHVTNPNVTSLNATKLNATNRYLTHLKVTKVNIVNIAGLNADIALMDVSGNLPLSIQLSEGDKHAHQSVAMSEWSGCQCQSAVYPIAA